MAENNGGKGGENNGGAGGAGNGGAGNGQGGTQQNGGGAAPKEATAKILEDGTVEIDGKKFINHDSYQTVAAKARERKEALEAIEKEKAEAERKRLEEEGKWKELAEKEKTEKETILQQVHNERRTTALKLAAMKAGAQNPDTVARLADLNKIELDENGSVKGESVEALLEGMKASDPYLFGTTSTQNAGASGGGTPQGGTGGKKFYRSQLSDSKFYQENRADILAAEAKGEIIDDVSGKPRQ